MAKPVERAFHELFIIEQESEEQLELTTKDPNHAYKARMATVRCKGCTAQWDVELEKAAEGWLVPRGPRNSLMAHAQKHDPLHRASFRRKVL